MNTVMAATGFLTGYIVPFVLVLSLLVFVHEMGHYLVGRWSGIRSTAFSIGFGPELIGFTDSHGTRWKISAIPLGGYVKFFGDEDASSKPDSSGLSHMSLEERAQTLSGAKLWKRAATVAAGPIANFILAILIFAVLFGVYGRMIADPVVAEVRENSAAAAAGVHPGDRLVAIDGEKVKTFEDVRRYVGIRPGTPITVTVERAGEELKLPMVPTRTETTDQFGNKLEMGIIGIVTDQNSGNFRHIEYSPSEALLEGVRETGHVITGTFNYIGNLVTGRSRPRSTGFRSDGDARYFGRHPARSGSFRIDRSFEPDACAGSGRRTSGVLCNRGHPRQTAWCRCAGGCVPYRHGNDFGSYGFCNME